MTIKVTESVCMHTIIDILQQSLTESVHVHVLILEVCACGLPQLYYNNNNIQENMYN